MPRSAASLPASVRNPLRMGVRKASSSSYSFAPFASPPSSQSAIRSAYFAHSYSIDRPPSAIAFWVRSILRTDGWWMMPSATSSGSFVPLKARIDLRSFAYCRQF